MKKSLKKAFMIRSALVTASVLSLLLGCTKGQVKVDAPLGLNLDFLNARSRTVGTNPTGIPSLLVGFASPDGEMNGFENLTLFLWPKRRGDGSVVNEWDRGRIVEYVNGRAAKVELNMFEVGRQTQIVCGLKNAMYPKDSNGCLDFWVDKPKWDNKLKKRPADSCRIANIGTWTERPTDEAEATRFDKCQNMSTRVSQLEQSSQALQSEALQLGIEAREMVVNNSELADKTWKQVDPAQGKLLIKFEDSGEVSFAIQMSIDGVVYGNYQEDPAIVPWDIVEYNIKTGYLNLRWREFENKDGQLVPTGAVYSAPELARVDKGPLTQFRGKVFYTRPNGEKLDGRIVTSGILRPPVTPTPSPAPASPTYDQPKQ